MKTTADPVTASTAPAPAIPPDGEAGRDTETAATQDTTKLGMIAQLRGLYADGRELVDAEIGFQKARMAAAGRQIRTMAVLAIVGLVLVSCALIALVVGTMIALIPALGAWGAMGATVAGTLVLAALCFWLAAGRVGKVSALFATEPTPDATTATSGATA
ncbi:phage holin family protein [Blastomonas sp.]|uniref:phage holin family protein n=1 Tax=Blastomonas sp. TaxID=1909299 RepID=UPI00261A08DA|nr:phage holin family protein [Blastomonas sp.]MDM7955628.1 phage holin family protein [Blastomonas sp.]